MQHQVVTLDTTQHLATRITMATRGSVVQFNPEKEEWISYVERLNYYLICMYE